MSWLICRVSKVVCGLGVAGVLVLGANDAFGRASYSSCPYHFPVLGACLGDSLGCVLTCDSYFGGSGYYPNSYCSQPDNCCVCRS
jgi:hypothetical protein